MKRSWLVGILSFVTVFAGVQFAHADLRVLTGPQGGTNFGTASTTDVGKALVVASTSPWLMWTLGTPSAVSTSTMNDWVTQTFIPCVRVATSTPVGLFGSICLEDATEIIVPFTNLLLNSNFNAWNAPTNTLPDNWNFYAVPFDGDARDGSAVQSKNTTDCDGGGSCVQQDITSNSDGITFAAILEQGIAYDPAQTYTGSWEFKRPNNNPNEGNLSCSYLLNIPITDLFGDDHPAWAAFWSNTSSQWTNDFSEFPSSGIFCTDNASTDWQTIPIPQVTGVNGTSSIFIGIINTVSGVSVSETVLTDNVVYGITSSTVITGENSFHYTSPDLIHKFHFSGADAYFDRDVFVTTTLRAANVEAGFTTTTQLAVTGDVTSGYVLGALDGAGLIGYFPPEALGPWVHTPFFNGFYLPNNKTACAGISGSLCDQYTDGVIGSDISSVGKIAAGAIDAFGQNQQFTLNGPNGNGDASVYWTSASIINATGTPILSGDPIGASGDGGRFTWYARKLALRAGFINGNQWDVDEQGLGSVAFGLNTSATGTGSFAVGSSTSANADYAFVTGNGAQALGKYSTAHGAFGTTASGEDSFAQGESQLASGYLSAVIGGSHNTANNTGAVAVGGNDNFATGGGSAVIGGSSSNATSQWSYALGVNNTASGILSYALGQGMTVSGDASFGINLFSDSTASTLSQSHTFAIVGGNVGIGTTTPDAILTTNGAIHQIGFLKDGFSTGASTNNLSLAGTKFEEITGVTQINCIDTTGLVAGNAVTLDFTSIITVKDEASCSGPFAQIDISGLVDFTGTGTFTVYYNGTLWREVSRTTF